MDGIPVAWDPMVIEGTGEKAYMLKPSPLYRDGLFYGPTSVHPEVNGEVKLDEFIPEMGLYTERPIPRGAFVTFYTGEFFSNEEIDAMHANQPGRFNRMQPYMVELAGTDVTLAADPDPSTNRVDPKTHVAATMNEPNKGFSANVFANTHTFEVLDEDEIPKRVKAVCLYTCTDVPANSELLYHYGTAQRMMDLRATLGYTPGNACTPTNVDAETANVAERALRIAQDVGLATITLYNLETDRSSASESDSDS